MQRRWIVIESMHGVCGLTDQKQKTSTANTNHVSLKSLPQFSAPCLAPASSSPTCCDQITDPPVSVFPSLSGLEPPTRPRILRSSMIPSLPSPSPTPAPTQVHICLCPWATSPFASHALIHLPFGPQALPSPIFHKAAEKRSS